MIEVEYYPSGSSLFPDPKSSKWHFANAQALYDWVQSYVCQACLVDFYEFHGKYPETLKDWLDMGCGCEIGITDNHNMIDWNYAMKLPDNFDQIVAEYNDQILQEFAKEWLENDI
jgi:hypothetical protein